MIKKPSVILQFCLIEKYQWDALFRNNSYSMLSPHTIIITLEVNWRGHPFLQIKKGDKVPLPSPPASSSLSLVPTTISNQNNANADPPPPKYRNCDTCVASFLLLKFRLFERRFVISLPTLHFWFVFFYSSSQRCKLQINGKNIGRKRALLFIVIGTIYISIFDL